MALVPPPYNIHPVNMNYKGRSYGDLIASWTNWLFSDETDYSEVNDILFLRGNIGHYKDMTEFYNKTNENAEAINTDTAVLLPVICTYLTINSYYEGSKIENELGLRNAVNRTVHAGGGAWARIRTLPNTPVTDIIPPARLSYYYVESPLYKLFVSEKSKLRDKVEDPLEPGEHDAITGGYFLLLKNFQPGTYRLRFGGKGKGNYITDSIYDIIVPNTGRQTLRLSSLPRIPAFLQDRPGLGI